MRLKLPEFDDGGLSARDTNDVALLVFKRTEENQVRGLRCAYQELGTHYEH